MTKKVLVFISYARKDGLDEAQQLYKDLQQQGIDVWHDTANINFYSDFSGEIDRAIELATHVAVIVTPDIYRTDSFVRLEIAAAIAHKKPIIPLIFPGGHCPITIINYTSIVFQNWDTGFAELLERLKRFEIAELIPQTQRERELSYLQQIGQRYDHWRVLYTERWMR